MPELFDLQPNQPGPLGEHYRRAEYLVELYGHARADDLSALPLDGRVPAEICRALQAGRTTSAVLAEVGASPAAWLYIRLLLEHPHWWRSHRAYDTRHVIAWAVTQFGSAEAPDHLGRIIDRDAENLKQHRLLQHPRLARVADTLIRWRRDNPISRRRGIDPDASHYWIERTDLALGTLAPHTAHAIANLLARELWGRWIVQDLTLLQEPHPEGPDRVQYALTLTDRRDRWQLLETRDCTDAFRWPSAEAIMLMHDREYATHVRAALDESITALACHLGEQWADHMRTFVSALDAISFAPMITLLAGERRRRQEESP